MNFTPKHIEAYAEEHSSSQSELLHQLYRETHLKHLIPAMISGPIQGRLLSMISHMLRPKRILEIGTYTGYSTLCLAEGMAKDGEIHTIDINEELIPTQQKFWKQSLYTEQIFSHLGNALEIIPDLKESWDLVFIDADKNNYVNYYEMLLPQMRSDSYIIVDNVLWYGKVAENISSEDMDTLSIDKLNKLVKKDERVEQVLLPVRDGITMIRVK